MEEWGVVLRWIQRDGDGEAYMAIHVEDSFGEIIARCGRASSARNQRIAKLIAAVPRMYATLAEDAAGGQLSAHGRRAAAAIDGVEAP
jgi:hypothetical protein